VAAGLGGGSSDAAAAIRILLGLYGDGRVGALPARLSASIGADVPVCLVHRAAWMRGLGERVTPVERLVPLPALLVNPGIALSTAAVFKALDAPPWQPAGEDDEAPFDTNWRDPSAAADSLRNRGNDLEAAAVMLEPAVATVLASLRDLDNCLLARLSGSGPT
jgi:4-diphosphocytidyl-2-C-methyl-D-erythritol kinase